MGGIFQVVSIDVYILNLAYDIIHITMYSYKSSIATIQMRGIADLASMTQQNQFSTKHDFFTALLGVINSRIAGRGIKSRIEKLSAFSKLKTF